MSIILILLTTGLVAIAVESDICEPYERLEEKLKCGKNGYLIHYGLRNCRSFNNQKTRALFSPDGQRFIDCTTSCLLDPTSTCSSVARDAFDSHTGCYIGCDFCKICKTDKRALWKTYSVKDFFSFSAIKQVCRVANSCSWFGFSCLW